MIAMMLRARFAGERSIVAAARASFPGTGDTMFSGDARTDVAFDLSRLIYGHARDQLEQQCAVIEMA